MTPEEYITAAERYAKAGLATLPLNHGIPIARVPTEAVTTDPDAIRIHARTEAEELGIGFIPAMHNIVAFTILHMYGGTQELLNLLEAHGIDNPRLYLDSTRRIYQAPIGNERYLFRSPEGVNRWPHRTKWKSRCPNVGVSTLKTCMPLPPTTIEGTPLQWRGGNLQDMPPGWYESFHPHSNQKTKSEVAKLGSSSPEGLERIQQASQVMESSAGLDDTGETMLSQAYTRVAGLTAQEAIIAASKTHGPHSDSLDQLTQIAFRLAQERGLARAETPPASAAVAHSKMSLMAKPTAANIYRLVETHFKGNLRFNEMGQSVEYAERGIWRQHNDKQHTVLTQRDMEETYGMEIEFRKLQRAIDAVARQESVLPIRDWLQSLPRWDGIERIPIALKKHWHAKEEDKYLDGILATWMVGAVSRAMEPGCQMDYTLVVEGRNGIGKSESWRALVGYEWLASATAEVKESVSHYLTCSSGWVVNLDEMASVKSSQHEKLLSWLVARFDHFRPLYGSTVMKVPRHFCFVGTSSPQHGWLTTHDGARRYLIFTAGGSDGRKHIDLRGIEMEKEQLWAEALELYNQGMKPILSEVVEKQTLEGAERRVYGDPWEQRILEAALPNWVNFGRVTNDQIFDELRIEVGKRDKGMARRIGDVMNAMGAEKKRSGNKTVWLAPPEYRSGDADDNDLEEI